MNKTTSQQNTTHDPYADNTTLKDNKIEEILNRLINSKTFQHTLKLVPSSQRELFISEIEKHLLQSHTESYKQGQKDVVDMPNFIKAYEHIVRKQLLDEIMEKLIERNEPHTEPIPQLKGSHKGYNDCIKKVRSIIKSKYKL